MQFGLITIDRISEIGAWGYEISIDVVRKCGGELLLLTLAVNGYEKLRLVVSNCQPNTPNGR